MENTRIGKSEAIALIVTIMVNQTIMISSKTIVADMNSSAIINTVYISIIALIISYVLYKLLSKFPTFDILDISNYLGGKILKGFIGLSFLAYFIIFSSILLKNFSYGLQTIYYTSSSVFFIVLLFLIGTFFVCSLKHNAIYRSNLLILPLLILSILLLFIANIGNFDYKNVFPILGDGINSTFFVGFSNLFAFQGLAYLLFLPPQLKDVNQLKKITLISILFSTIYLLVSVSTILLLFDSFINNDELFPLYSAVKYIEFGTFFQRLDSLFILIWIISCVSSLSITVKTCCGILRKLANVKSEKFCSLIICITMLCVCLVRQTYAVSSFWANTIFKYAFFTIMGISFAVLLLAFCLKLFKNKYFIVTKK